MRLLITGACGFIGTNFILNNINNFELVVNLDSLSYAANPVNLSSIENYTNYVFIHGSIANRNLVEEVIIKHGITHIVNFAAESHVDRSILDASPFINTNVLGTINLLECVKKIRKEIRFLQVSTDEVYGSLGKTGKFTENSQINPSSPYSASKASADHFVRAYAETYGLDVLITRCSNNYGPYQFPEKLIPLMINNIITGKDLPIYGDGLNVRDWIHVNDHCNAINLVLTSGISGNVYNIGADSEKTNIDIVRKIIKYLDKSDSLIKFVKDRPGHDKRYSIDSSKIFNHLGWKPQIMFDDGLEATIDWYINNQDWTQNIVSGEYQNYYNIQYGNNLRIN